MVPLRPTLFLGLVALVALLSFAAACGGPSSSPAVSGVGAGPSPGCACAQTIPPVSNPSCQAAGAPIATLGRIEGDLRAGNVGDGYAESVVVGIQQALVTDAQQTGSSTPLGQSLQGVVSALGELGVSLNQNRSSAQLEPQLAQVDAAVAALAAACASAG